MQTEPASEYARLLRSRFARLERQEIAETLLEELCSILAVERGKWDSVNFDLEHVAHVYALGKARFQGEKRPSEEKRVLLQIAKHEAIVAELWDKLGHEGEIRLLRDLERRHARDSVTLNETISLSYLRRGNSYRSEAVAATASALTCRSGPPKNDALEFATVQLVEIFWKVRGRLPPHQRVKQFGYAEDLMAGPSRFFGLFFQIVDPGLHASGIGKAINRARRWARHSVAAGIPDSFNCRKGRKLAKI